MHVDGLVDIDQKGQSESSSSTKRLNLSFEFFLAASVAM